MATPPVCEPPLLSNKTEAFKACYKPHPINLNTRFTQAVVPGSRPEGTVVSQKESCLVQGMDAGYVSLLSAGLRVGSVVLPVLLQ